MKSATERDFSKIVWVMGAGRFGGRAIQSLSRLRPHRVWAVDSDSQALSGLDSMPLHTVAADAVTFLKENLDPENPPEWIVPCVPFHLSFRWLLDRLGTGWESRTLPDSFRSLLPHPFKDRDGGFLVSLADFVCPPDCPEPADLCTHTRKPRLGTLFQDLDRQDFPGWSVLVLRSRQLAPGIGALRPTDLFDLESRVKGEDRPVLVATACRCHGVMHGLSRIP